jgi:hypothetical protein
MLPPLFGAEYVVQLESVNSSHTRPPASGMSLKAAWNSESEASDFAVHVLTTMVPEDVPLGLDERPPVQECVLKRPSVSFVMV